MLKTKVGLVTGASSGIGRAIALQWAREGAKVVVSDVNTAAGEETVALVLAQGGDALFVAADVGSAADSEALVQRTVAHYGRLDLACNNAGIGGPQAPTADYPLDGWAQVININLSGVFYGMKYQIAAMLEGGGGANGALLRAGLIDELSLVICPVIDGSTGGPIVFNSGDTDLGPAPSATEVAARLRGMAEVLVATPRLPVVVAALHAVPRPMPRLCNSPWL